MDLTDNIYMPNKKSKRIKITSVILLAVLLLGTVFGVWSGIFINKTHSYFAVKDSVTGEIKVKGAQIKVLQKTDGDYVDVTDDGFDLGVKYFVPDREYSYDIVIKNSDSANVTAGGYYLRWSFTAVIDGEEVDIGEYCESATTLVHKQQDSDGRIRFYTISGSTSSALSAQQTTTMLSKIKFTTKDSTNILDQYTSGSKIKIICNIEGQLDPYVVTDVATPTYTRVDEDGNPSATGNYILFGYYPKTVATSAELASITSTNKTDSDGYYLDADGNRYKKFTANPYGLSYTFSDGNTITSGTEYYFKLEQIKWRILETNGTTAKLLAEDIIDAHRYWETYGETRTIDGTTIYPNNYKESEIRAWLNGYSYTGTSGTVSTYSNAGFLQTAFTSSEQAIIQTTTVDNSLASTGDGSNSYVCENTNDKVFLLSRKELTTAAYGFSTTASDYDTARRKKTTDYAKANYAYINTSTGYLGNGWWWSRSPGCINYYSAWYVYYYGYACSSNYVNSANGGVVPALVIAL